MAQDPTAQHEESPPAGFDAFTETAASHVFGQSKPIIDHRVCSIQTLGADCALRLAIDFLLETTKLERVYVPNVFPGSTLRMLEKVEHQKIDYFDEKTKLISSSFVESLETLPEGSVVVLEAGGFWNPSGVYPSDWDQIISIAVRRRLFLILGATQCGLVEGAKDAIQTLANSNVELMVCQEFTHTLAMYDHPTGLFSLVAADTQTMSKCSALLERLMMAYAGSSPAHGARIVAYTLTNGSFKREWAASQDQARARLKQLRIELYEKLRLKGTPETWSHIVEQRGLYSWLGLNDAQVEWLRQNDVIIKNRMINISCLNDSNIDQVASSIDEVARIDFT